MVWDNEEKRNLFDQFVLQHPKRKIMNKQASEQIRAYLPPFMVRFFDNYLIPFLKGQESVSPWANGNITEWKKKQNNN